jgi:uncharacterized damage-inducible protein DinB
MEIREDFLEPVEGYSNELAYYVGALMKARAMTRTVLEDLTPAEIARRVLPEMHSIGALALHLGEAEYYWIQEVAAGRDLTDEERAFAHMFDTMEQDYDRGLTAEYCIGRIDAISAMTRETLKQFSDDDLQKVYVREYDGARTDITLRSILFRLIDHEAHHRGQLSMIKRVIRGGETVS